LPDDAQTVEAVALKVEAGMAKLEEAIFMDEWERRTERCWREKEKRAGGGMM
jgi:hypothetical protein